MRGSSKDTQVRRVALLVLGGAMSVVGGRAIAGWTVDDVNAFYTAPADRYATPAYARRQPVAETFWQWQDGSDAAQSAGAISTATSEQPAYRSASGS